MDKQIVLYTCNEILHNKGNIFIFRYIIWSGKSQREKSIYCTIQQGQNYSNMIEIRIVVTFVGEALNCARDNFYIVNTVLFLGLCAGYMRFILRKSVEMNSDDVYTLFFQL